MKKILRTALLGAALALGFSFTAQAAPGTVKGKVTDSYGEPLIGAAVMEKGTTNGTVTDFDGLFELRISSSPATLVASSISYRDKEFTASAGDNVTIVLEDDSEALEEVVVVGYGTQKKVNLTGAVSSINFDDKLTSRPLTNVSNALNGLSAGVAVTQTSGKPGSSATISIRGNGTLNNNAPLVLVDGVEWDMDNVNPEDIENISILKDASSTAIYGALGANGVILITTKHGNGNPKIAYTGYVSRQNAINKLALVSDYAKHMELSNEYSWQRDAANIYDPVNIELWRAASKDPNGITGTNKYPNYMVYPNTDWFDTIFNTGYSQNHHVSMTGSSEKINYSMGLGYLDNEGVMNVTPDLNSSEKKVTMQAKVEGKVGDWLTVGANVQARRSNLGQGNVENAFKWVNSSVPGIYPGDGKKVFGVPGCVQESADANNLLAAASDSNGERIVTDINVSGFFTANLYKGLTLEAKYNYQLFRNDATSWSTYWERFNYNGEGSTLKTANLESSTIGVSDTHSERQNTDIILRYNTSIKDNHNLAAIVGFSTQHYVTRSTSATRKGLTSWELHELSTASTLYASNGSSSEWAMESIFGRINYNYQERYLAEANLRYDGSSRFSPDSRWGVFPSFSAGWRINKEEWMQDTAGWLSNLKLRASWGKVGNNRTSDYAWQGTYGIQNVVADGQESIGLAMNKIGNTSLEWETTTSTDFGLDFGMFDSRLTGEIDIYDKNTTGILYVPSMYLTMGIKEGATENIAEVNNKGVELTLNWSSRIGEFFYSVGGNMAFNRNLVTKYKGKLVRGWNEEHTIYRNNYAQVSQGGFGGYILEDHPLGDTYHLTVYKGSGKGYRGGDVDITAGPKDGMIRTESDMDWVKAMLDAGYTFMGLKTVAKDQFWYGDLIYADYDGDGNYGGTNDYHFTGHTSTPKVNYAINLTMSWRQFDFYALLSGAAGFYLNYLANLAPGRGATTYEYVADDHYFYNPVDVMDSRTNVNAHYPRMGGYSTHASDFWEYKGDYLKLKNVQFGYTIPERITSRANISKARAYISADNLFNLTKFPGMDPELGATITYPIMRQLALGLQLTF
ncbi:MAG: TonB-dependent receptor [Bacteroidales bacterium]|nr:TonB-dependent receptor [Candidatus Cryptobacteroides aphodequi]